MRLSVLRCLTFSQIRSFILTGRDEKPVKMGETVRTRGGSEGFLLSEPEAVARGFSCQNPKR